MTVPVEEAIAALSTFSLENTHIHEGKDMTSVLYTYQSNVKALPQVHLSSGFGNALQVGWIDNYLKPSEFFGFEPAFFDLDLLSDLQYDLDVLSNLHRNCYLLLFFKDFDSIEGFHCVVADAVDCSRTELLNRFQYSETFKADREVRKGLYTTIERMYPDMDTRIIVDEQLEKFKNAEGMFGMDMAKLTRDKKQPALWWESFGEECKELQRLAIRVLSGTCSATGCERNWSIFDIVHSKRRNRLETQRMNALVFVKYNIQLELRQEKRQKMGDTYDPICLSDMESDDEWITEKEGPVLPVDHSWMDIEECFKDDGTVGKKRKRVLDDNEVIELEGEEEEEEEEFDEATMADDNDDDDDVEELDIEDD
ncbi:hypothetical protein RHGRI_014824 [Rhododendron griersonianum]|uniref:HAT C-terminal dimerisation domain-containing protein n=1 Tax=Rhododendron griersonianum TaxID=479676 RepID=A0AAV6KAY8_9ERIC|nr:hypothetical protein RHGRI_014824 [Rhododendron griersonianum]